VDGTVASTFNGVAWEERLSELANYRKLHGHCNIPRKYVENITLANWVTTQRVNYRWHKDGKPSPMTPFRIQELESLGFEWDGRGAAWTDLLSELAEYRKIHGHCNVPRGYSENTKLATWVKWQKEKYRLLQEGKTSPMTLHRIQELENLGFEWDRFDGLWEDSLSELADYRKIHGHCNIPQRYSENVRLGTWVSLQIVSRRKEIVYVCLANRGIGELGFQMDSLASEDWEDRLSKLANCRRIHGYWKYSAGYVGQKPKEHLHVAPRKKNIKYDHLPNPSIEKPRL
jgi:hypothetical protein